MKPIAVELGESVSPSLSGSKEGRHQGLSEKAVYGVVVYVGSLVDRQTGCRMKVH